MNFNIIEIPEEDINSDDPTCIMNAFPFMVEDKNGLRWFGAETLEECENYIMIHTNNQQCQ